MRITSQTIEEDDALAAEYVLGVLDLEERISLQSRMNRDAAFSALVDAWTARLSDLNDDYEPVAPPDLLPAIENRLFLRLDQKKPSFSWLMPASIFASLALTTAIVAFFLMAPQRPGLVVALSNESSVVEFEIRISGNRLVANSLTELSQDGKAYELWAIAPGQNPRSLGLIDEHGLQAPFGMPFPETTFAVSLEPEGGSPSGLPTGPVIAAGTVTAP